jgi:phosphatidylserine synthase
MTATLAKIMAVATSAGTMVDSVADSLSAEVSPAAVVASMVEADPTVEGDRMAVDVTERQFC